MYQFVDAICLSRSLGSKWEHLDISNVKVSILYTQYTKIYLVLSNIALPNNVYVDMDSIRNQYSNYTGTLNQLLVAIGNNTLLTVEQLPSSEAKYATYSDAIRARYKYKLTIGDNVLPVNYPLEDKYDIALYRPNFNTDMKLLHEDCLISINGYYHFTATDNKYTYVFDAAKTMRKSNNSHIGLLSFSNIGKLLKIPLTAENIYPAFENGSLSEKIYFTVDADLDNKSYILVLGGYLIFPNENVFYRIGDKSFSLNLNNISYIERVYESSQYMDLSKLELTEHAINSTMINTEELWSDDVIKRYMTLSQSYLVIVDIPMMLTNKIFIRSSNMPGMFTSYQEPKYPLMVNYGKVAEYWKTYEDDHWAISVQDSFIRNYILTSNPEYTLVNVTSNLNSDSPYRHSKGFFLEISGYNL